MPFEKNVFVNCPFDKDYLPLLRPILFSIMYLGFTPQITLQTLNSAEPRITKIISLINGSKYAVHDLSRIRSTSVGEYFRLNMPFELGLDVGCRVFKGRKWAEKKCLILETERYRYQAAISDLSNSDIAVHENSPLKALSAVRNWLNSEARLRAVGPAQVWADFNEFMADNYTNLKTRGYSDKDIDDLPVAELIDSMAEWIDEHA